MQINLLLFKLLVLSAAYLIQNLLLLFISLFILDGIVVWKAASRSLRKPVFTIRAKRLFATSAASTLLVLLTYFWYPYQPVLVLLLSELAILISPFLGVFWTAPIVNAVKRKEISAAQKRLVKFKPTVIGITGSYGKTTTKEFVFHLLAQKYKTAKTTGSENTEFGIARKTIRFVTNKVKYFVVEMGAYKKGEIAKLAEIVHPKIGIITGIEPQHLSLFGSLQNIMKTKYELIESLPKDGVAIFNYSNKRCRQMAKWAKKRNIKTYGYALKTKGKLTDKPDLVARIKKATPKGIDFEVKFRKERKMLSAPVRGVHFIENLAGAILLSRILGVGWEKIKNGCQTITLPEKTMQVYQLASGAIIIDDSYNSTPASFNSALEYLGLFKDRTKYIITPGIIELGEQSEAIHKEIGRKAKNLAEAIIMTSPDFYKFVQKGLGRKTKILHLIEEPEKIKKRLKKITDRNNTVLLLEGRVPSYITSFLKTRQL